MKFIDELVKYQDSVHYYRFLNQILNIIDTLYHAEKKLQNYHHDLEFDKDFLIVKIEYFTKKIQFKIEYDLDAFMQISDNIALAISENSLKYDIPIEFINLIATKDCDGYTTKIKHNEFCKLSFVPLKRLFRKNDSYGYKGYDLFLSNDVEMIKLPKISSIEDLQNILIGFAINLD